MSALEGRPVELPQRKTPRSRGQAEPHDFCFGGRMVKKLKIRFAAGLITQLFTCVQPIFRTRYLVSTAARSPRHARTHWCSQVIETTKICLNHTSVAARNVARRSW